MSGLESVDETAIFSGFQNSLIMNQTYTHTFQCNYKLSYYPFDTQVYLQAFFINLFYRLAQKTFFATFWLCNLSVSCAVVILFALVSSVGIFKGILRDNKVEKLSIRAQYTVHGEYQYRQTDRHVL